MLNSRHNIHFAAHDVDETHIHTQTHTHIYTKQDVAQVPCTMKYSTFFTLTGHAHTVFITGYIISSSVPCDNHVGAYIISFRIRVFY